MRIVSRKEFLELPVGTVYAKYLDGVFDSLAIKRECKNNDWWYSSLVDFDYESSDIRFDLLDKAERDSLFDLPVVEGDWMRDGLFAENDRFVIFSKDDIRTMIQLLQSCL